MANNSSPLGADGLSHFDLPTVFRCAVELAEAAAISDQSEWASPSVENAEPDFRWLELHRRLQRILEETERLKRSLGAMGPFGHLGGETDGGPKWESYDQRFSDTSHDRIVRLALLKLATASIDLSGFSTWREWQWHMQETGLRLLTWGLAQLWDGMSEDERSGVRDRLPRTSKAVGWPADSSTDPAPYHGPEEIPVPDQYRIVSNYVSCYPDYLGDIQKADSERIEQGQEKFLRVATVAQFVEVGKRATQSLQALTKRDFDTPDEWGELYTRAFLSLACLRRAHEIPPRETWPTASLEHRKVLADAAKVLMTSVGRTVEAKAGIKPAAAEKAFEEFTKAIGQLKDAAEGQFTDQLLVGPDDMEQSPPEMVLRKASERMDTESNPSSTKPAALPKKPKRSTERGEGRRKLIAGLTKHHEYADRSCLNLEPIGNNELARLAEVSGSTASAFFKKEFEGHTKYRAVCGDKTGLVAALKLLNQEFSPHHLFGGKPPGEDDRGDEE